MQLAQHLGAPAAAAHLLQQNERFGERHPALEQHDDVEGHRGDVLGLRLGREHVAQRAAGFLARFSGLDRQEAGAVELLDDLGDRRAVHQAAGLAAGCVERLVAKARHG